MKFKDLRDFVQQLEQRGELKRIQIPVSPVLEMTEVCDRTLRAKGPALLFENPTGYDIPVLGNLFGTPERVAMGMGAEPVSIMVYVVTVPAEGGVLEVHDRMPRLISRQ